MPITAKFSKENTTYRNDLRGLDEPNVTDCGASLLSEIDRAFDRLEAATAEFETRMVQSMFFFFWVATLGTVVVLLKL